MKVAITTPTNWPEVRRGGERFANELAAYLAQQGHAVTVICGKAGRGETERQHGYETVRHRRLWHPFFGRFGLLEFHMFFFPCLAHLLRERFDVVVSLTFMDALAAIVARRFTGAKVLLMLNGIPPKKPYFRALSLKGAFFRRAVLRSDLVVGVSDYVRAYLERRWGRQCIALAPPVDAERFRPKTRNQEGAPVILCAAALDDARKGGRTLMRAFNLVKGWRPDAQLWVASRLPEETKTSLRDLVDLRWRDDVRFLDASDELGTLFDRATISVLPSLWEPYGMVVIESMAAGTPVVGTADGALPELIGSRDVGRLFDPGGNSDVEPSNAEGLAKAIDECLDLAALPETRRRCREHALRYSWTTLGPTYERLLEELADPLRETRMAVRTG